MLGLECVCQGVCACVCVVAGGLNSFLEVLETERETAEEGGGGGGGHNI